MLTEPEMSALGFVPPVELSGRWHSIRRKEEGKKESGQSDGRDTPVFLGEERVPGVCESSNKRKWEEIQGGNIVRSYVQI